MENIWSHKNPLVVLPFWKFLKVSSFLSIATKLNHVVNQPAQKHIITWYISFWAKTYKYYCVYTIYEANEWLI